MYIIYIHILYMYYKIDDIAHYCAASRYNNDCIKRTRSKLYLLEIRFRFSPFPFSMYDAHIGYFFFLTRIRFGFICQRFPTTYSTVRSIWRM